MLRAILYFILFSLAVSVIKAVAGILAKAFSSQVSTSSETGPSRPRSSSQAVGELRKDPVCGTFVSTSTAVRKTAGGEMYYFCSADCRDKFAA